MREEMGKPALTFLRNGKKYSYNGKRCPKCTLFWVYRRVMLILICFMAFGNLYLLDLLYRTFIINISKKKHRLRHFTKPKGEIFTEENFAEFSFAIYDLTHRNLFWK